MNVIWWNASRGNWDHGLLMSVFDRHADTFTQLNAEISEDWNGFVSTPDRKAIVIVSGNPPTKALNTFLNNLYSGIVIFTSDEEARWDIPAIVPPHLEVWSQYYKPGMNVNERLLMGYPSRLKDYKVNLTQEKKYLWSFIGQVQNPFRQQCVDTLKKMPDGFLRTTDLFGGVCEKAIEYQEYLDICAQSRYVICPSGSFTAESFRLYEALETGAIPIVDARSPVNSKDFNYWNEVYPKHKLITVNYWDEKALSAILNIPNDNNWWHQYKKELEEKLIAVANG